MKCLSNWLQIIQEVKTSQQMPPINIFLYSPLQLIVKYEQDIRIRAQAVML